ncbi:MAG: (2Fe-2S) ferredoxin domain-containing protein [Deltaproteobacteria bacterium]|nr:(2Fe-2S) ferredoxin domain-containing protein [Deltaproteobacteria bacterium]MCF8120455.1 (2Fe-2S) ferredoxin domain-containing protein [Deltaproteobacteria bacterium]
MAKLRVEDLKKIKEASKGTVNLRDGAYRVKITVHMGTCGIAAGARKIMNFLLDKIQEVSATDIILTSSGCAGLCNHEPMITVEVKDGAPVKYVLLDEEKTQRIFEEHVMKGNPLPEYALSVGSETTY